MRLRRELEEEPGQDCGANNGRNLLQQIAQLDEWAGRSRWVPSGAPSKDRLAGSYARPRECYQIDATEVRLTHGRRR